MIELIASPSSESQTDSEETASTAKLNFKEDKIVKNNCPDSDSSSVGRPDSEPETVKAIETKKKAVKRKADLEESNNPSSSKSIIVKRRRSSKVF